MSVGREMFFAGLAGKRAENMQTLEGNKRAWKSHAQNLEKKVDRLNTVAKQWQDEAIKNNANAIVGLEAFEEVVGHSVREHFGDQETDRRKAEARIRSKNDYGV
jgi:ATP-dependent protease HslVU (ClpYQ) peptidase subunit